VGLVHALQVGFYVFGAVKQAFWVLFGACAVAFLFHTRLVRPLQMRGRPWRVVEVRRQTASTWSLELEPEGHSGMEFRAGQYAWLTLGATPFTLQQHPFSFASSDTRPERLEFAIKELGDFTSTIGQVKPGTRAFLEGPYGAFTLDEQAEGAVFVAGGIGITPMLSMLRSARARGDRRAFLLIYANGALEKAAFRDELQALTQELDLEVVHVVEHPPEGWQGESGFITPQMLQRLLASRRHQDLQYFVCGPVPMMDLAERALLAQGVPPWRLDAERFDLV
jgi:predicted ferric reductase